jgi:hypothetical protein
MFGDIKQAALRMIKEASPTRCADYKGKPQAKASKIYKVMTV